MRASPICCMCLAVLSPQKRKVHHESWDLRMWVSSPWCMAGSVADQGYAYWLACVEMPCRYLVAPQNCATQLFENLLLITHLLFTHEAELTESSSGVQLASPIWTNALPSQSARSSWP